MQCSSFSGSPLLQDLLAIMVIPVVIALHFALGLGGAGRSDEVGVEQNEDVVADAGELGLDLGAVGAKRGSTRLPMLELAGRAADAAPALGHGRGRSCPNPHRTAARPPAGCWCSHAAGRAQHWCGWSALGGGSVP